MNIVGERILIFGDSLSHHGVDSSPEIWDVDAGTNRTSSAPGDLLASHLLEQGAEAVRIDANVSRSAANFWRGGARYQFHSAAELIASDQAWRPTKVIVMLGTNDAGAGIDRAAMTKIRDTYKAMGAEVWAIGPPLFPSDAMNAKADQVYSVMKGIFGGRLIDARPLTPLEERTGDGIHFRPVSASILAMQLLNSLLVAKAPAPPWVGIVLSVGLFGAFGLLLWRNYKSGALGDFDMLKVIAAESRSPEEFARRAEAWASSEANPPSITKMTTYYRRAKPWHLTKLIKEAREKREAASRERHRGYISQREDDDADLDGILDDPCLELRAQLRKNLETWQASEWYHHGGKGAGLAKQSFLRRKRAIEAKMKAQGC